MSLVHVPRVIRSSKGREVWRLPDVRGAVVVGVGATVPYAWQRDNKAHLYVYTSPEKYDELYDDMAPHSDMDNVAIIVDPFQDDVGTYNRKVNTFVLNIDHTQGLDGVREFITSNAASSYNLFICGSIDNIPILADSFYNKQVFVRRVLEPLISAIAGGYALGSDLPLEDDDDAVDLWTGMALGELLRSRNPEIVADTQQLSKEAFVSKWVELVCGLPAFEDMLTPFAVESYVRFMTQPLLAPIRDKTALWVKVLGRVTAVLVHPDKKPRFCVGIAVNKAFARRAPHSCISTPNVYYVAKRKEHGHDDLVWSGLHARLAAQRARGRAQQARSAWRVSHLPGQWQCLPPRGDGHCDYCE